MNNGVKTIIYPVNDITKAKNQFRELLGVEPYADQPYYVGFRTGGHEIGLDPNAYKEGATVYYLVDDIKAYLQTLLNSGVQVIQEIKNVGGGRLISIMKDNSGNVIELIQDP